MACGGDYTLWIVGEVRSCFVWRGVAGVRQRPLVASGDASFDLPGWNGWKGSTLSLTRQRSCARQPQGRVWSAGYPQYGQLGDGDDHMYNAKDCE